MEQQGLLESLKTTRGNRDYLIALDGTDYFSSGRIHCKQCSPKTHEGKITYHQGMINPAFVAPGIRQAIALPPEFIVP